MKRRKFSFLFRDTTPSQPCHQPSLQSELLQIETAMRFSNTSTLYQLVCANICTAVNKMTAVETVHAFVLSFVPPVNAVLNTVTPAHSLNALGWLRTTSCVVYALITVCMTQLDFDCGMTCLTNLTSTAVVRHACCIIFIRAVLTIHNAVAQHEDVGWTAAHWSLGSLNGRSAGTIEK